MSKIPYLADNIAAVQARIIRSAERAGRNPQAVRLVAVTKTVESSRVCEALAAGVRDCGENYVQEARAKIPEVSAVVGMPDLLPAWHFIGHLQSNKAKYVVELFSLIHSVESLPLAQEIGKQASKRGKIQDILIEINLAEADGRSGVAPANALRLAAEVATVPGVRLRGLMGMAPYSGDEEIVRPCFRKLHALWEKLPEENRHELSMGMSNDFEIAVEEGATLVRIGTALFGARKG